jgi:hypothetical protein
LADSDIILLRGREEIRNKGEKRNTIGQEEGRKE